MYLCTWIDHVMIINRYTLLILILGFLPELLHAQLRDGQNYTCETALPFCTGTQYAFPAAVNAGEGEAGPCYNCLINTPNPAWYYLRIANPGNIIIKMLSQPPRDIDFCCWGPFDSPQCCGQLTCDKVISCNYGGSSAKYCTIPNGLTGQYYMLVVTNISNLPCNIIFTQTDGTGSTDCSILPPPCSNNSPICADQTLQFNAATVLSASYYWTGPNGFSSGAQNPTILNAQAVNSGDYYLHLIINGQPATDSILCPAYVYDPLTDAGEDTIIPTGQHITLHCDITQGSGSYQFHWEPANYLVDPDVQNPTTIDLFSTMLFTVSVTDDSASCEGQDFITVYMSSGVLSVNAMASPSKICAGQTTELQAHTSGGSGIYTYLWTGPSNFTSDLQNITIQPSETSTYIITIFDGFSYVVDSVTVIIDPLPVAYSGSDQTIAYGTYTFLDGSASGGSGNYFYSWSPASKLINPNVRNPQTTSLVSTTVFTLIVTDLNTNCSSENPAIVSVAVTGGPLNVNPVATPKDLCPGDTTQLHASAGGGNVGFYQYEWSSAPPGFSSSGPDPFVRPEENTTFTVKVTDGFNTVTGSVAVSLFTKPVVHVGPPDTTICIYDTYRLDAGNPGCEYLWSNGATVRSITVKGAGIVPETQHYSVKVSNDDDCFSVAEITINFSYTACAGITGRDNLSQIKIFPNPSEGIFTIECDALTELLYVSITGTLGKTLREFCLDPGKPGHATQTLDLSELPGGLYLITFRSNSQCWTEKLIIE
jgi:hypothetical protein